MKILSVFLFTLINFISFGQGHFTITGKIELLSTSKKIFISAEGGNFEADIKSDGSFFVDGQLSHNNGGLIKTDSSGSDGIWLEPGVYTIKCREIPSISGKGHYFRITEIDGPKDAKIYWGFLEPRYYIRGTREEIRQKQKDFAINYLDSLFNNIPQSKAIPEIIKLARASIGDEAAQVYMSFLNNEQLKTDDFKMLTDYFKRKEKMAKEVFVENFEMKDQNGKNFKLSSINRQLILLDFWSTDCLPCRKKHPRLAELYKEYRDKGFEIISISLDDDENEWKKGIVKDKMIWINVSELNGWKNSLAENYFIKSMPFSIWLDKNKKIISIDDLTEDEIKKYLE